MSMCLGNFTSDDAGTFSLHNGLTNSSALFNSILLVKTTPVTFVNMTPTPITMTAGQQMNITCITSYCNPPAKITWYMSPVDITNQTNVQTNVYDGLVRTMSTLSINAVKSDNGKHVYCTAGNNPGERVNSTVNVITVLYRPEVTSNLSSPYIVEEGQTVSLSCAVIDANPNTNITWRWFRTDRPYNSLFYGPNYTVSNIQRNMSGSYSCTARNSVGTSEADVINVDVQYKPDVITRMPSPYRVIEGQKATLECLVTAANPNTSIIWRWFKTDIPSNVLYNGSICHVHDIQRTMSGLYNCTASNSVGTAEAVTIAMDVLYKPEVISSTPNQYKIIEGRNGILECLVIAANPNTNIIWKWINTNNPSNVLHNGSAYTISNIHRNRTGLYNCTAANSVGTSIAVTIAVDVMYKPHVIDSPSITINETDRVVLTKEIASNPLSNVSWYNGSELLLTQYAVRTATFIIQKATCTDTKNFTLIASNIVERNVSALVEVIVNCKPRSYKTNYTLGVTDTFGIDFSTFVIAYPEPLIKLEYENGIESVQMMKSINRNAVNNYTIHISQAVVNQSDFGIYYLKALNLFGELTVIVNVIPQRKPNMPVNIEIVCEETRAKVQWKSSFNGGDRQVFTIFASNGQHSEHIPDKGENVIHSAFIENLQPSTTYVFYVSAQNSHGFISSERISCTTLAESSNNLPVITGGLAAGGITLGIVVIAIVVVFRRFKKSGSQASNNPIRANEDATHYTTLAERNEHSERNVYDILTQNEGANQYEAYLMKESQETKSQMYESLQRTEVSDKRNICDKQMIAKYTKGGIKLTVIPSNDVEVNQTVTLRCELDPNPKPPIIVSFENNFTEKLCFLEHSHGKCITTPDTCVTGYNASCHNETLYSLQVSVPWKWNGASIYCQTLFSKSELVVFSVKVPVTSVILTPTPIIALAGQQINITCTTSYCYPPAYVMWYMSSTDITSLSIATKDETEDFVRTVSFLSINLGKSDNGKHVFCIARNIRDQSETSMMNTVTVLFKPEVTSYSLNPYIVIEGHRATLKCVMIAANPNTSIIWRWSRTDRPKDVLYYGPNYTIPNIQRNRSGTYNCTASNSVGTSEPFIINVDVQYKPEVISNSPSQYKVIEGNTVTLECILIGANPNTNIMWRWFRTEYPSNILYDRPIYTIFNIQRDMSGPYSCTASNSVGTSKVVTIYVDVLYKPKIVDTPSTIVNESDRAILSREMVSNPLSNVSWYNGSVLLRIQTTVTTATYIIEKATCTDTKNFTLIASNIVERNVSALVELLVNCKPQSFKRNITLGVSDATGIAFSMTVIAYPEPLYELRYDNGTRNTRMDASICRNAVNNFTIHFKQTVVEQDDYGIYHLLVSNAFGESIVILNVLPQRKPEDPTILKIVCEETRAKVQWKSSFNGGNTQTFIVTATYGQYQKFESNIIYDKGENIIHSAYIQNLQPSTRYVLYVSAQNRHGSSSSENATCTTLTDNHERNIVRNDPMRTNEDASHYTTLAERQENGQMYESLKNAETTENRNICDKQMIDKNPKDLSEIYVNHSVKANNTEYINLSFST